MATGACDDRHQRRPPRHAAPSRRRAHAPRRGLEDRSQRTRRRSRPLLRPLVLSTPADRRERTMMDPIDKAVLVAERLRGCALTDANLDAALRAVEADERL